MAETYAKRTVMRGNGLSVDQWITEHLKTISVAKSNSETINIRSLSAQGLFTTQLGRGCIVFNQLRRTRAENRGNHGGHTQTVCGSPVIYADIVSVLDDMLHQKLTGMCCVPIFRVDSSNYNVLLQCGAQWMSCGRPFDLDITDDNAVLMYLYAIQSIVWTLMNERSKERTEELIGMVRVIYASARSFFEVKPQASKLLEPLKYADDAVDMLNRALVFMFTENPPSTEDSLRIVEVSLKRWMRNIMHTNLTPEWYEKDFIREPLLGLIAVACVAPMLRKCVLGPNVSNADVYAAIEDILGDIGDVMEKHRLAQSDARGSVLNKAVFKIVWERANLPHPTLDGPQDVSAVFYDHCTSQPHARAPLVQWGLLPECTPDFECTHHGTLYGKRVDQMSKIVPCGGEFEVSSTNPAEWTPLQIFTPGKYSLRAKILGTASLGKGNVQGEINCAVLRFTSGHDILGVREGASTAGLRATLRVHGPSHRKAGGKYIAYEHCLPVLDPQLGVTILMYEDGAVRILNHLGYVWYEFNRSRDHNGVMEPLLLAFKFMTFTLSRKPLDDLSMVAKIKALSLNS